MEAIFTLSYPEYTVAITFQNYFKKGDGYSVHIPLSRQQKGIDLLLYNQNTKKAVSLQIKSSRTWYQKPPRWKKAKERFQYAAWFRNFRYEKGIADFYALFILYPKEQFGKKRLDKAKRQKKWWNSKVLIFNDSEMHTLLRKIKTKEGKAESFFYVGFNENTNDIFITRGFPNPLQCKDKLLENKIREIKRRLK